MVLVLIASVVFDVGTTHIKSKNRAFAANCFFLVISAAGAFVTLFLKAELRRSEHEKQKQEDLPSEMKF